MSKVLYTIGYEGRTIDEFIDTLMSEGIKKVIDVRYMPNSRKKGFSKTKLSGLLAKKNIDYYHVKEFGTPKSLRDELRKTNDYNNFFAKYRVYLSVFEESLYILQENIAFDSDIAYCLMCYERDYRKCHRSVLADYLAELNPALTVVHL